MTSSSSPLARRAVICTLSTGAWRVEKSHDGETRAVNAKHGTRDLATVKVSICEHPALLAIYKLLAEARAEHNRLTLPAGDKGVRLLPVARQMEHTRLMADFRARLDTLLRDFLAAYPAERASAPARLNGLYVERQWPATVAEVEAKFAFLCRYLPVPEVGQWTDWMNEAAAEGQADLHERLRKAITLVAQRLADPKGRVFDSLTGNLAELIALVPDLNLAADPTIAAMADKAKALLEHDTDTLRDDPLARADIAAKASEIVSLFNLS